MYIRFMAATDGSPVGLAAHAYLQAFVAMKLAEVPIRIVPVTLSFTGIWELQMERNRHMITTRMEGDYVNVVCCSPERWAWRMNFAMPNKDGSYTQGGGEVELYTQGRRNVLLIPRGVRPTAKMQVASALKYELLVVTNEQDSEWWRQLGAVPVVIPAPVGLDRAHATDQLKHWIFNPLTAEEG